MRYLIIKKKITRTGRHMGNRQKGIFLELRLIEKMVDVKDGTSGTWCRWRGQPCVFYLALKFYGRVYLVRM